MQNHVVDQTSFFSRINLSQSLDLVLSVVHNSSYLRVLLIRKTFPKDGTLQVAREVIRGKESNVCPSPETWVTYSSHISSSGLAKRFASKNMQISA